MSEYIECLIEPYNEEKNNDPPKSYVEPLKKLLNFYGIETD